MKKIGIVGATGVVGKEFLSLMETRNIQPEELRLFASRKDQNVSFNQKKLKTQCLCENAFDGLDLVFFSSGDEISEQWAPRAVEAGAFAVDNSAAFRMNKHHKLVVPEVNGHLLKDLKSPEIIANPNCSTIQLTLPLKALEKFGIKKVIVASYQAVSGAGRDALEELHQQSTERLKKQTLSDPKVFTKHIGFNCLPQIGSFNKEGLCSEEEKIMNETPKILELPELPVSAITVRVPVFNAHSEAVWITLDKKVSEDEILDALEAQEGLKLEKEECPTALDAQGQDDVLVGRVHTDPRDPHTWKMWIVSDNLRKGAALNSLQIAIELFNH